MKGLQYPANAHGQCHNVFKHLSLPQNTQKLNALGNIGCDPAFVIKYLKQQINDLHSPKGNRDDTEKSCQDIKEQM